MLAGKILGGAGRQDMTTTPATIEARAAPWAGAVPSSSPLRDFEGGLSFAPPVETSGAAASLGIGFVVGQLATDKYETRPAEG